jgi:DNA polymerase-3 subunit delta'
MLPGAMDSLLKTLEEPPANSHLIVVTDKPNILTPTILSRLRRVNFPSLDLRIVSDYIKSHAGVDDKEAAIYSHFTEGTLYNIDRLIDKEFFELREMALQILTDAVRTDAADLEVKYSDSPWLNSRDKVESLILHWQNILRDLMLLRALDPSQANEEHLINIDFAENYQALLVYFVELTEFERSNFRLEQVKIELRRNVNPKMAAFSFLFTLNRNWKDEEVVEV